MKKTVLAYILIIFLTLIIILAFGILYPSIFAVMDNVSSTANNFTAPLISILGTLLLYITIQQQFKLIQQPNELKTLQNNKLKELIINDLKFRVRPEIIKVKNNITDFMNDDIKAFGLHIPLDDTSMLNIDIFSLIPISEISNAFNEKDIFLRF